MSWVPQRSGPVTLSGRRRQSQSFGGSRAVPTYECARRRGGHREGREDGSRPVCPHCLAGRLRGTQGTPHSQTSQPEAHGASLNLDTDRGGRGKGRMAACRQCVGVLRPWLPSGFLPRGRETGANTTSGLGSLQGRLCYQMSVFFNISVFRAF